MAITRQKKEELLKELVQLFAGAQSVAFGQYSGMTVEQLQEMRKEMRKVGVEFKVAKKTLIKLAAKENGLELPDEILEGTIGAAFSKEDIVSGPKLLKKTAKKIAVVKLLGGVMEGKVLSVSEMGALADLPSREQLLAQFVGMMQGPLRAFHGMLSAPTASMARALDAYAKQIPVEASATPVAAPAAPEPVAATEEAAPAPAEETPAVEEAAPAEEAPAETAATE